MTHYTVVNLNNGASDSGYNDFETANEWAKAYSQDSGDCWLVAETPSPQGSINNVINQQKALD